CWSSCCLSFHGEPFHGCAVFHPGPLAAGSEGVGNVSAADALVAPPFDDREGFSLVVFVGCEAYPDFWPPELLCRATRAHVALTIAADRVAGVGLHEHRWTIWPVPDAVECGDHWCR